MKKRKKTLKVLLTLLVILAAAVIGAYAYLAGRTHYVADEKIERQEDVTEQIAEEEMTEEADPRKLYDISTVRQLTEEQRHGCYTMLIICADNQKEEKENEGRRSDAEGIILMTINHAMKEMYFTTLHADLYAVIPGEGGGRLGHAYAIGGGPLLTETIEANYGVDIGNYAVISLRDVARELEMDEFEDLDISRDGLDVVEKMIYSLNYDNPLKVAAALNNILKYVTHNMSMQDIANLTLQIPIVVPYYSEKIRLPQDGDYQKINGFLVPDIGKMSRFLQDTIYAVPAKTAVSGS